MNAAEDLVPIKVACGVIGGRDTPIHESTYRRGAKKGIYPKPIHLGPQIVRVSLSELQMMIEQAKGRRR